LYPEHSDIVTGHDLDIDGRDLSTAEGPVKRAEEILRQVGRNGFTTLQDMLKDFVTSVYGVRAEDATGDILKVKN
jgi:hypothetical protein